MDEKRTTPKRPEPPDEPEHCEDDDSQGDDDSKEDSFEIPYAGEVTIQPREAPPTPPPTKRIHRRRPLPATKDRSDRDKS